VCDSVLILDDLNESYIATKADAFCAFSCVYEVCFIFFLCVLTVIIVLCVRIHNK